MGAFATAILWTWTALGLGSGQVRAAGPVAATIVVQVAEDDGAAAHELGSLVQRHGDAGTPRLQVEAPPAGVTRLGAARAQCIDPTLGVFWLDATRPEEWRLYALPCATGRPLVREIVFPAGEEQAAIESAWLIVHSSAVAIAEGHGLAMREANEAMLEEPVVVEPATPPPPAAPPTLPPPATRPRALGLRLSVAYAGAGLARALPWGHGAWGAIAWAPRPRLRLGAWYEFVAAGRLDEPAGFRLWRHAMAITIAAVIRFGGRWAIELRSGPELELSRWRSDAAGGRRRPIPRVGADATLSLGVGRLLTFDLGVGLAVPLVGVDFVTCADADRCSGADRRVVLDAWAVAPRARLGLSVQF